MIQAPARARIADWLRVWRSRLATFDDRAVMSGAVLAGSFTWAVLIFFLGAVAVTAVQMWLAVGAAHQSPLVPEAIYFAGLGVVVCSRAVRHVWGIIACTVLAIALCVLLDAVTHADWGNIGLYAVIVTVIYRLPPRLSLPISAVCAAIILTGEGLVNLLLGRGPANGSSIVTQALIIGFALAASFGQRSRHLFIAQLELTQARLREEMARTAELAAARERARIARDIHDVLAHSLTVLSVQAQALRQLVRDNPERAAAILDQMAEVLRESQAESRQVVGLLREALTDEEAADVATRLRVTAERFAERTGMHCTLREHGSPARISAQYVEALRFALQESLTNAYRHGRATHTAADLWWERDAVRLVMRDDGADGAATSGAASGGSSGSGNGLRGMRERAEALGGTTSAGPRADGAGFEVSMTLPLDTGRSGAITTAASQAVEDEDAARAGNAGNTGNAGEMIA